MDKLDKLFRLCFALKMTEGGQSTSAQNHLLTWTRFKESIFKSKDSLKGIFRLNFLSIKFSNKYFFSKHTENKVSQVCIFLIWIFPRFLIGQSAAAQNHLLTWTKFQESIFNSKNSLWSSLNFVLVSTI